MCSCLLPRSIIRAACPCPCASLWQELLYEAYLNLLFTGVAVVVAAVVEVFKSPAWMVSVALSAPAAVIFPRSAPDDGKKPEGKGNTSTFNFGKVEEQRGWSTWIPPHRRCWSSRPAGVVMPAIVVPGLLAEVRSAAVKVGMLASVAPMLLGSAPAAKRKPKGREESIIIV